MVGFALLSILGLCASGATCATGGDGSGGDEPDRSDDPTLAARLRMVATQIEARGVRSAPVLEAMREVPRHRFVPDSEKPYAYIDAPRPIGYGQTISQPYIVALMSALLEPEPSMKVLEVGTGSGYQAAVLAECVGRVYTIEIVPELGRSAASLLEELGYDNVEVRIGDGFVGWPEEAPFDAIIVTAAPRRVPPPLEEQLAVGGRLVIPVGTGSQDLIRITRTENGFERETITAVRFVPMTGKAQER